MKLSLNYNEKKKWFLVIIVKRRYHANLYRPSCWLLYFAFCYTVLTSRRPNQVETALHGCILAFSVDPLSCCCCGQVSSFYVVSALLSCDSLYLRQRLTRLVELAVSREKNKCCSLCVNKILQVCSIKMALFVFCLQGKRTRPMYI